MKTYTLLGRIRVRQGVRLAPGGLDQAAEVMKLP